MKRNFKYLAAAVLLSSFNTAFAQSTDLNYDLLSNDKEERSLVISQRKRKKLIKSFSEDEQYYLRHSLYSSVQKVKEDKEDKKACDLGLIDNFFTNLESNGFSVSKVEVSEYLKLLRSNNSIDDIFYKLLVDLSDLKFSLVEASDQKTYPRSRDIRATNKVIKNHYSKKLYSSFSTWPDEEEICSLGEWYKIKNKKDDKGETLSNKEVRRLNAFAYSSGDISLETFRRLEYLRESDIYNRIIFTGGYLNKVLLAKNIMTPKVERVYEIPVEEEEKFASKKSSIFKKVSLRESLYERYNDEQIVVLAGILKKASMRMGVDPDVQSSIPVISQVFTYQDERGEYVTERDDYELENASDQYNYARKRMRMDIYKTNSYKSFSHVEIKYEDVVMAALETGYITHEEIELVMQYDDLWNKEESKLVKALRVVWGIGSTAIFYLPPPYNILGGIGVALINAKIINKKDGADNDNPAALFN